MAIGRSAAAFAVLILIGCLGCSAATTPPAVIKNGIELRGTETLLSLPKAFDEGLIRSPRTAAIRLQLGITKSQLVRATEMPNPTIFMDNGYNAEFTYRYGVLVPLEQPWKLVLRVVLAKNQIKQTDLEILKALWIFRANVRRAYTELIIAQELYRTLTDLAALTQRLAEVAQKRFEAGDVAELDAYRAQQEAAKTLADKEQQQFKVLEAQQALAVIIGRTPQDVVTVPLLPPDGPDPTATGILPVVDPKFPDLSGCVKLAMQYRPELKVARQAVKTNGANLKVALGNVMPNTAIGIGSSVVNGPALRPDAPPTDFGSNIFRGYFMQVFQELPLLNFQQGDISLYRATGQQLRNEVGAQENIVTQEVATAYQRLCGAKRKIEIYQEKLLKQTLEIARLARLSYEVGQSDINSVLLAQQATIEIKTEYLEALSTYQQAFTDLEQSIGITLQ